MEQTQSAPRKPKLQTIDGNTLMAMDFEPLQFTTEKILPHGLFILAGSPKIGKSWLALDLCRAVATGGKLWDFTAQQGDVLYFALEDRHRRVQDRLKKIQAENINLAHLHTNLTAAGLHNGLLDEVNDFISCYPRTNLIIIDTFEHIRNGGSNPNFKEGIVPHIWTGDRKPDWYVYKPTDMDIKKLTVEMDVYLSVFLADPIIPEKSQVKPGTKDSVIREMRDAKPICCMGKRTRRTFKQRRP